MSRFITRLAMEAADDTDNGQWILTAPLEYQSSILGITVTVPAGFRTDLASVPRLPIVYMLTGDTASQAAVIHDYLYGHPEICSRKQADAVLSEASAASGVPGWRRWLMWAGVRIGGGSHYTERQKEKAPEGASLF